MQISITKDYPGGNIHMISQEDSHVQLQQEMRDSDGWWFYWNFCAEASEPGEVIFEFTNGEVIGPYGPAISEDGIHWYYDREETFLSHTAFRYHFGNKPIWFAYSIPYQLSQLHSFLKENAWKGITCHTLCVTEQGREIPLLRIGAPETGRNILLTCRHHACESCASYVLEGVMDWLLAKDNLLVRECCIHIVPMIDLDGVENGDQGKNRLPHDHNRDYTDQPIYAVTKALYQYTENTPLLMGFDFHCPWKWGDVNSLWSIVQGEEPFAKAQQAFSQILEKVTADPKIYTVKNNTVFGSGWNIHRTPSAWRFFFRRGAQAAFSLETPYFGEMKEPFSQDFLRKLGHYFAAAMEQYYLRFLRKE